MYAVVKSGGKQYRVEEKGTIRVEKIEGKAGDKVKLSAMGLGDKGNFDFGSKGTIEATILKQDRNDTITVFKKRRRQNSRRTKGHRQPMTTLKIESIKA